MRWSGIALFIVYLATASLVQGQDFGTEFNYQGRLADSGSPANGDFDFQISVYTEPGGGSLGGPTFENVPVVDGVFSIPIDLGTGIFDGGSRFLEISVRPSGTSTFTTLSPLIEVKPTPYSLLSATAEGVESDAVTGAGVLDRSIGTTDLSLDARSSLDASDGSPTSALEVDAAGEVGIGTSSPDSQLHVFSGGDASLSSDGFLMLGSKASRNLIFDTGEIQARIAGAPNTLAVNDDGGAVSINADSSTGGLGIGTGSPDAPLHITNGGDASLAAGGQFLIGSVGSMNLIVDNNEIMARDNGAASLLRLNMDGGDVSISGQGSGSLGVGTNAPDARMSIENVGSSDDELMLGFGENDGVQFWFESAFKGLGSTGNAMDFNSAWLDSYIRFRGDGLMGLGTPDPVSRVHLMEADLGVTDAMRGNDEVTIEAGDAAMGLYSSDSGTWGSAVSLKDVAGGALVDHWAMARRTSSNTSSLHFSYGTEASYGANTTILELQADGDIITQPQTRVVTVSTYQMTDLVNARRSGTDNVVITGLSGLPSGVSVAVRGPVVLPDGATITKFIGFGSDSSNTSDMFFRLKRRFLKENLAPETMAVVRSTLTPGSFEEPTTTISSPMINNRDHFYYVEATFLSDQSVNSLMCDAIQIEYEVTTPFP